MGEAARAKVPRRQVVGEAAQVAAAEAREYLRGADVEDEDGALGEALAEALAAWREQRARRRRAP